jgi:hypothetical protein
MINRPADEVFAFVSDYGNDVLWRKGVHEMTPTPAGKARSGTRVHEVLRFAGSTHVTDTEVMDVVEGRSLRYEGGGSGGRVRGRRMAEPSPSGGTVLTTEVEVETTGVLRFLEPLLAPMFRRNTRRDLETLRGLLEAQPSELVSSTQ